MAQNLVSGTAQVRRNDSPSCVEQLGAAWAALPKRPLRGWSSSPSVHCKTSRVEQILQNVTLHLKLILASMGHDLLLDYLQDFDYVRPVILVELDEEIP